MINFVPMNDPPNMWQIYIYTYYIHIKGRYVCNSFKSEAYVQVQNLRKYYLVILGLQTIYNEILKKEMIMISIIKP